VTVVVAPKVVTADTGTVVAAVVGAVVADVADVVAVVVPVAVVDVVVEPADVDVEALAVVDVDFPGLVVGGPVYSPTYSVTADPSLVGWPDLGSLFIT
jgi:hypothetical protein